MQRQKHKGGIEGVELLIFTNKYKCMANSARFAATIPMINNAL